MGKDTSFVIYGGNKVTSSGNYGCVTDTRSGILGGDKDTSSGIWGKGLQFVLITFIFKMYMGSLGYSMDLS